MIFLGGGGGGEYVGGEGTQQNTTENTVIFLNCFGLASVQLLSPSHNQVMVAVNMGHGSTWSEYRNHKWTGVFTANLAAQA